VCDGGHPYDAYDKVKELGGITTTNWKYLYDETIPPCDKAKANSVVTIREVKNILTEQEMIDYVLKKRTLAVFVAAQGFGLYVSGIYSSCTSEDYINHAVNIVGVNVVEKYWIVRNEACNCKRTRCSYSHCLYFDQSE
jgi:Papain family cysteine protease